MTNLTLKMTGDVSRRPIPLKRQALYVDVADPGDPDLLFENAEIVADTHGPWPALDYLYEFAREPKLPREAWTRRVMVASCIEYLLEDFFYQTPPWEMIGMFDPERIDEAVRALSSPRGMVAMTFHAGFSVNVIHFFAAFLKDGLMISPTARTEFGALSAKDPARTLIAALRALRDGRSICIAPDGEVGKPRGTIQLLGAECAVNDGAAFLAYESGCDTALFTMLRNGRLFVPLVVPGPSRAAGETFKAFGKRLMEFYRDRIEEHFLGDPDNLAISKEWRRRLKAAVRRAASLPKTDAPTKRTHQV